MPCAIPDNCTATGASWARSPMNDSAEANPRPWPSPSTTAQPQTVTTGAQVTPTSPAAVSATVASTRGRWSRVRRASTGTASDPAAWIAADSARTNPADASSIPRLCAIVGSQPSTTYASSDCRPMNSVTHQASPDRHTSAATPRAGTGGGADRAACAARRARGSHSSPAIAAGTASRPSGSRHDASKNFSTGTTSPDARDAPVVSATVYTAVTVVIRDGWSRLMIAGIAMLPMLIAIPAIRDPANSGNGAPSSRSSSPATSSAIAL